MDVRAGPPNDRAREGDAMTIAAGIALYLKLSGIATFFVLVFLSLLPRREV